MSTGNGRRLGRRAFLASAGLGAVGSAVLPRLRVRRARAQASYRTRHVVVVGIAGGLRNSEALGMVEGATLPNLFGDLPWLTGYGAGPAGPVRVAPEYAASRPALATPPPLPRPLAEAGAVVTNLRYAEGPPGHLQGQACLATGVYNQIENRADALAPAPTLFELHRRATDAPSTDAWYVSGPGGFYRALQRSGHEEYGARFGGRFLSPPLLMSPLLPVATSGQREIAVDAAFAGLPTLPGDAETTAAVRRLTAVLDAGQPPWRSGDARFRGAPEDNAEVEAHLSGFHRDPLYGAYYPGGEVGVGLREPDGGVAATSDALTVYHAERVLERFRPAMMLITMLDVDAGHADFNGYLRGQVLADALVRHLWEFIQRTPGLRDQTTLLVLPEHGRHLDTNGQNPDSLGRSGLDHGRGDDGDRDVFLLALGPDVRPGTVVERTDVVQRGRTSGRYETIDAIRTAGELLGVGDAMDTLRADDGARPGLLIEEILE